MTINAHTVNRLLCLAPGVQTEALRAKRKEEEEEKKKSAWPNHVHDPPPPPRLQPQPLSSSSIRARANFPGTLPGHVTCPGEGHFLIVVSSFIRPLRNSFLDLRMLHLFISAAFSEEN